jgi:hypothetical protein
MVIVCCTILWGIRHSRVHWYLVAWAVVVALAFASYPIGNFRYPLPTWLWQIVLVSTGVALAVKPLLSWKADALDQNPVRLAEGQSNRFLVAAAATPRRLSEVKWAAVFAEHRG